MTETPDTGQQIGRYRKARLGIVLDRLLGRGAGRSWSRKTAADLVWNIGSLGLLGISGILINTIIGLKYGTSVLGQFNLVFAAYIVFSQIGAMGFHLSALKHVAEFAEHPGQRAVIIRTGFLLCVGSAITSSVAFALAARPLEIAFATPGLAEAALLAAPGTGLFALNKYSLGVLNGLSRLRLYAVFQGLRPSFLVAGVGACALWDIASPRLGIVFTVAEALVCLAALPVALRDGSGAAGEGLARPWLRRHLAFGMRSFPSNLLIDMNSRLDLLILGLFVSDRLVGIYSFAAAIAEGVYQIPIVVRTVLNSSLVKILARRDHDALHHVVRDVVPRTMTGMAIIAIAVAAVFPAAVHLLGLRSELLEGWPVLCILLLSIVLGSGYMPMSNLLLQAGWPGIHTGVMLALIAGNLLSMLLLVPPLGILGAAIATGLSFILMPLAVTVIAHRRLRVSLGWRRS